MLFVIREGEGDRVNKVDAPWDECGSSLLLMWFIAVHFNRKISENRDTEPQVDGNWVGWDWGEGRGSWGDRMSFLLIFYNLFLLYDELRCSCEATVGKYRLCGWHNKTTNGSSYCNTTFRWFAYGNLHDGFYFSDVLQYLSELLLLFYSNKQSQFNCLYTSYKALKIDFRALSSWKRFLGICGHLNFHRKTSWSVLFFCLFLSLLPHFFL